MRGWPSHSQAMMCNFLKLNCFFLNELYEEMGRSYLSQLDALLEFQSESIWIYMFTSYVESLNALIQCKI